MNGNGSDVLAEKRLRAAQLLAKQAAGTKPSATIRRRPAGAPAPLSFAQHRLWFLDRLIPGSTFYNLPAALRFRTPIDTELVRRTMNEIVRRHDVLRSSIIETDGSPVQTIAPSCEVPFLIRDLRHLDPAARECEALRLAAEHASERFDLSRPPQIRAGLLQLADDDRIFLINAHHIASDLWSMNLMVEEFRQIYAALANGAPVPLPELPIQYPDYAAWQHERVASGALDRQLSYWTARLANLPVLELPADFAPAQRGIAGETLLITIPRTLSDRVHELSRRNGTTTFVTLLACFNALLSRYTGQEEIVVGAPVANRNRVELERLVGLFVNTLVLRSDVSGDPTFRELLRRTSAVVMEAMANAEVPFELLVERLKPERRFGHNPLFQVTLQYFSGSAESRKMPQDLIIVEKGTAGLDLSLDFIDSVDGLLARVEFSTEIFRRETVQRLIAHYQNLLVDFATDANRRVSEAAMLSAEEMRHVLSLNAAEPPASYVPVTELVEAQVRQAPSQVALEDGGQRLTYADLDRRANALARRLRNAGAGAETLVAVLLERSVNAVVSVLAAWKAGAAYMPVEPSLPEERIRLMLADARPAIVLTVSRHAPLLRDCKAAVVLLDSGTEHESGDPLGVRAGEDDLAYVIYTSGSTGTPKGVMVTHGAISRHLQWMQAELPLSPSDRTLFKYSFSFDVAVLEMFTPLIAGARTFVVRDDGPLDFAILARQIRDDGITTVDLVPSMLAMLLEQPPFSTAASLRRVVCGGEAVTPELVKRLLATHPVEFVNMYGPTEATISATWWRTRTPVQSVPIGRAVGPCSAVVLDPHRNPLPTGIPGELYLGGHCLARGYLGREEMTRQRFPRDPFSEESSARLYRTGDRCRMRNDGTLEFLGRIDEMVKVRGHRVELGEIEAALSTHPLVKACTAAVTREAQREQLAAYIVPNTGAPELWPSAGEYFVYDELLYQLMTQDHVRMRAYRSAIQRAVRNKVVVDIGTGADLALGRMCLEAGARRVYAIEMLDDAFERAVKLAAELELGNRLILIHGDARIVKLPEKADVCVSELLGTIGSSEGVIPVLNDAQSFLRPGGEMIPYRCITRIAAVSLPPSLRARPAFGEVARTYTERIFALQGRRFDLRICLKNLSPPCVVSDAAVFEDLTFDRVLDLEETRELRITIARDCLVDGLLLWIQLYPGREELIDVISSETSWLPVFFPLFSPAVALQAGDVITATASRLVENGSLTPDYVLRGSVLRDGNVVREFAFEAPCHDARYAGNPFYAAMHRVLESGDAVWHGSSREITLVEERQETYEHLYTEAAPPHDDELDLVGWKDESARTAAGADEMREQVEGTAARVRALGGKRILDIGCGTGLLLLRLAGGCERYVGTDFSAAALARTQRALERRGWKGVELWHRHADDFTGIEPGSFDVVVLNSVGQYFPSVEYFLRVLEGAVRTVRDGGFVFVGDVRNLRLQRMLHAGLEVARAAPDSTAADVRERVEHRLAEESELLLDPELFYAAVGRIGGVTAAQVQVRHGGHPDELTRFRYDAILQVGGNPRPLDGIVDTAWPGIDELRELTATAPALRVRGVRGERLERDRAMLERLDGAEALEPVQSLRDTPGAAGVDPEALWDRAAVLGRDVQVLWSRGEPWTYDVLLLPQSEAGAPLWASERIADVQPWSAYANAPLNTPPRQHIVESVREHLRRKLPEYMVPTAYVFLDALPLAPSGKVDRRALPPPAEPVYPRTIHAAPETDLERKIVAVLQQVLGIRNIGTEANFFHIGGHSLIATQVVSRLSDALGVEVPLRLVFENPVIADFAGAVEELRSSRAVGAAPRIRSVRTRDTSAVDPDALTDEQVNALLSDLLTNDDMHGL